MISQPMTKTFGALEELTAVGSSIQIAISCSGYLLFSISNFGVFLEIRPLVEGNWVCLSWRDGRGSGWYRQALLQPDWPVQRSYCDYWSTISSYFILVCILSFRNNYHQQVKSQNTSAWIEVMIIHLLKMLLCPLATISTANTTKLRLFPQSFFHKRHRNLAQIMLPGCFFRLTAWTSSLEQLSGACPCQPPSTKESLGEHLPPESLWS